MCLKSLNENEILSAKINKEEAEQKGLITEDNYDLYIKVQALYKKAFDNYIESVIKVNDIVDKKLEQSNLDYGKLEEKQKNIYQKFSYLNSEYLFVRNFFYIERLSENDLNKFIKQDDVTAEIIEVVKSTYKNIMKVNSDKTDNNFKVCYGRMAVPIFFFDNDSLVLFLNYGKNSIKLEGKDFIDNKVKKEKFLDELIELIKCEFEAKLECKVEIRYYKGII